MLPLEIRSKVIDYIEAYHTSYGTFPRRQDIMISANIAYSPNIVSPAELDEFFEAEETILSLNARGIIPPWILANNPTGLTKEQLAAASTLTSIKDRRSDEKKLRDLGVTHKQFTGWMHSKTFSNYMKAASNNLVDNFEHEAHVSLLRSLGTGNTQAIKLYYELTGRYNPAYENTVNVQQLMTRLIEIIQSEVDDPKTLSIIASKFQMAAAELGSSASPVEKKELTNGVTMKDSPNDEFKKPIGALYF